MLFWDPTFPAHAGWAAIRSVHQPQASDVRPQQGNRCQGRHLTYVVKFTADKVNSWQVQCGGGHNVQAAGGRPHGRTG
jgi:hypothetical protein